MSTRKHLLLHVVLSLTWRVGHTYGSTCDALWGDLAITPSRADLWSRRTQVVLVLGWGTAVASTCLSGISTVAEGGAEPGTSGKDKCPSGQPSPLPRSKGLLLWAPGATGHKQSGSEPCLRLRLSEPLRGHPAHRTGRLQPPFHTTRTSHRPPKALRFILHSGQYARPWG